MTNLQGYSSAPAWNRDDNRVSARRRCTSLRSRDSASNLGRSGSFRLAIPAGYAQRPPDSAPLPLPVSDLCSGRSPDHSSTVARGHLQRQEHAACCWRSAPQSHSSHGGRAQPPEHQWAKEARSSGSGLRYPPAGRRTLFQGSREADPRVASLRIPPSDDDAPGSERRVSRHRMYQWFRSYCTSY